MLQIKVGATVRIYYDDDLFDEGVVTALDERVTVDFFDWIEEWGSEADFTVFESWLEGKTTLVPLRPGTITTDFRG